MLINFWYAAARSAELGRTPLRVRMLGQPFALFRDAQGRAQAAWVYANLPRRPATEVAEATLD